MSTHPSSSSVALPVHSPISLGFPGSARRLAAHARRLGWIVLASVGAAGCSASDDGSMGTVEQGVTTRWTLPADVRAAGASVRVPYENAPSWSPSRCGGRLLDGTAEVGAYLREKFEAVSSVGGYACRANTANGSQMSVHGTGRALDIFIPLKNGRANEAGDAVANWLVEHAGEIGVQLIIWNRSVWRSNGSNEKAYSGPHPHHDHLHVEITSKAAKRETPFFALLESGELDQVSNEPNETDGVGPAIDPNAHDLPETAGNGPPWVGGGSVGMSEADAVPRAGELETHDHDHDHDHDDAEPGELDSIGAGIRDVDVYASDPTDVTEPQGCSASPVRTTRTGMGASVALVLAAALVRRRRTAR